MLNVLYNNAASLHSKMHELRARATDSAQNGLAFYEMWGRREGKEAKLAIARYRLFKKDSANIEKVVVLP